MDNAYNNDTMIMAIEREVPSVKSTSRLRCAVYVLKLIVKAILYGDCITVFDREIIGCGDARAFELWRKFGAIGKVHNTVEYIMRSDQRHQEFLRLEEPNGSQDDALFEHKERLLVKDGGVRWNSTYYMFHRALELKDAITNFQKGQQTSKDRDSRYSLTEDKITEDEWDVVLQ